MSSIQSFVADLLAVAHCVTAVSILDTRWAEKSQNEADHNRRGLFNSSSQLRIIIDIEQWEPK